MFLALHYFPVAETALRIAVALAGAVSVGCLGRGQLSRALRQKYPNARWVGLLAVGFAVLAFGGIARFVVPGGEESGFALVFILPAGACLATFVIVNRKDPDVTK